MPHPKNRLLPLLSHLLAAAGGYLLWTYRADVGTQMTSAAVVSTNIVVRHLQWFMTAKPAGVKLHLQVAHIFGTLGIHYITFFQSVLSLVPSEALNLLLGIAALYLPLAGTGRALNRLAWTIGVLSLPITVAYALMATLYKFHFKGTIKTWMAMRGKATLPFLPQPIAPQTASSDGTLSPRTRRDFPLTNPIHLAVAALLFMPFLLTFPTTAWYYAYVCVLHLGCSLLVEGVDALGAGRVAVFRQISVLEVARKCAKGDILGLDRWATVFVPAMKQHQA